MAKKKKEYLGNKILDCISIDPNVSALRVCEWLQGSNTETIAVAMQLILSNSELLLETNDMHDLRKNILEYAKDAGNFGGMEFVEDEHFPTDDPLTHSDCGLAWCAWGDLWEELEKLPLYKAN